MSPRPGAFQLAASSNGELHLISDLPHNISVSKVLWDALAAGAHPHARIELGGGLTTPQRDDLVIETVECTFRYRREEWDEAHDHYLCTLVSRTNTCTCGRHVLGRLCAITDTPRHPDPECPVHGRDSTPCEHVWIGPTDTQPLHCARCQARY